MARYYGDSLVHLIASPDDPDSHAQDVLAATILLSSYEVLVCGAFD